MVESRRLRSASSRPSGGGSPPGAGVRTCPRTSDTGGVATPQRDVEDVVRPELLDPADPKEAGTCEVGFRQSVAAVGLEQLLGAPPDRPLGREARQDAPHLLAVDAIGPQIRPAALRVDD